MLSSTGHWQNSTQWHKNEILIEHRNEYEALFRRNERVQRWIEKIEQMSTLGFDRSFENWEETDATRGIRRYQDALLGSGLDFSGTLLKQSSNITAALQELRSAIDQVEWKAIHEPYSKCDETQRSELHAALLSASFHSGRACAQKDWTGFRIHDVSSIPKLLAYLPWFGYPNPPLAQIRRTTKWQADLVLISPILGRKLHTQTANWLTDLNRETLIGFIYELNPSIEALRSEPSEGSDLPAGSCNCSFSLDDSKRR